jgi:hypothetical protein
VKAKQLQRQVVCTVLLCFFRLFLFDRFSACCTRSPKLFKTTPTPAAAATRATRATMCTQTFTFGYLTLPCSSRWLRPSRGQGNDLGRNKCHDDGGGGGDLETNHLAVVAHACVSQNKKSSLNGVRVYRSRIQRDSSIRDDDPRDLEIRILLSCLF